MHVLTEVLPGLEGPFDFLDLGFPRFTTRTGRFVAAGDPGMAKGAAASLKLRGPTPAAFVYEEDASEAERSPEDPEADFKGHEEFGGELARISAVSGPELFSAAIYLIKTLHERNVTSDGKWIYTRLRTPSVDALRELVADDTRRALEVRTTALRDTQSSANEVLVDGNVIGEVFFARISP
ncbi:hypothetical protein [Microbaculum marinum]|uniref:Uncharacterized protein n=1 Tax=Microbaculum marinum TaxID=1764581 RepID=A0AAW9RFI3_9HYPH